MAIKHPKKEGSFFPEQIKQNDNRIVFCFKFLTLNKDYNLGFFEKNTSDTVLILKALFKKLKTLGGIEWGEVYSQNKKAGIEYLGLGLFNHNIFDELEKKTLVTKDMKFISIRFCAQDCRIIGMRCSTNRNVLHILGFDFDLSLYNHGK